MKTKAYVVDARRTAIGKAPRGVFRQTRPDTLLVTVLKDILLRNPSIDKNNIADVIIGCAMPEAEQGMNIARNALLLADFPNTIPAMTINRFCSSGVQTIAMAADRIRLGEADLMIAGGVESMSMVPMGGHKLSPNPEVFHDEHQAIAYGMGLTAEIVAKRYEITQQAQCEFAFESHQRAGAAIANGLFKDEITQVEQVIRAPDLTTGEVCEHVSMIDTDEGPRLDTSIEKMLRLQSPFAFKGSVTAATSSQMSDGAACLLLASEQALKDYELTPIAEFDTFAVTGCAPEIMGVGPVTAIPKALKQTGMTIDDVHWIELNEAFAAQTLAVINELNLDKKKVNPLGGAIALGHPLGATGAVRATTLMHAMKRDSSIQNGIVTMCIGTGMGACGVFKRMN